MDYQHIRFDQTGSVATLTFNRPSKANALHFEHLAEIEHAVLQLRDNATCRVVIFEGAGKHFSSGADLTDPGEAWRVPLVHRRRRLRMGERVIEAILGMDQISIAAWQGAAMGGGACIATACDFRIGAHDCFMQYPEVDIGLNLMWKSLPLIVSLVGPARAKRLVAGGERVEATRLATWGVLDECVPREQLAETAATWAERYAHKPPIAVQMIKQSVNQIANAMGHAIMHMDTDQNLLASGSEDRQAAIDAYLAGSNATYSGN